MLIFTQNQISPEIGYIPEKLFKKYSWRPVIRTSLPIFDLYPTLKVWLIPSADDRPVIRQLIYHAKGWSGLSLRPRLNQAQETEGWCLHYDGEEKILAGPFESISEAHHLASLLARFDWTRPADKFSRREINEVKKIITEYMREISWIDEIETEVLREFF